MKSIFQTFTESKEWEAKIPSFSAIYTPLIGNLCDSISPKTNSSLGSSAVFLF